MTKNDIAWNQLNEKYAILQQIDKHAFVELQASTLNEFREARLMSKFDFRSNLPVLFKEHDLSILPNARGSYIVGRFDTFEDVSYGNDVEVISKPFPSHIESIDVEDITSESIALNTAFLTGILGDFIEDEELALTVNGRMSSAGFDFRVFPRGKGRPVEINVDRAQIEIDGGYEGLRNLTLIEAKNSISNTFQIRQLYYPFQLFNGSVTKSVRNIFMTYSNGVFHLREYKFEKEEVFNSITLVKELKYDIVNSSVSIESLQHTLKRIDVLPEPQGIPFPQADSFERVINFCELLKEHGSLSKEELLENYDLVHQQPNSKGTLVDRQIDYYTNAARYLGLAEKYHHEGESRYRLTDHGEEVFNSSLEIRKVKLIESILHFQVFNQSLELYFEQSEIPTKAQVVDIMREADLYRIGSDSTYFRRSSTVIRWLNWILQQSEV